MKPMRILVIAARVVGHRCLKAMLDADAGVCALLYLDDGKADKTVAHSGFDDLIAQHRLNARAFTTLKGEEGAAHLQFAKGAMPDLGIVIGVSELVPDAMLALPPKGFIGMHPTMLPQGRGRAPIPWALIHDLKQTGVTLFYADAGADTGDILDQEAVPIFDTDTAPVLGSRTDVMAARLFVKNMIRLADGTAPRIKQNADNVTVWPRRRPEDGLIDWRKSSRALYNWVRALTQPYPGAFTYYHGRKLFIWAASQAQTSRSGKPGTVLGIEGGAVLVATGDGAIAIRQIQFEGEDKTIATSAGFLPGMHFGDADTFLEKAVAP